MVATWRSKATELTDPWTIEAPGAGRQRLQDAQSRSQQNLLSMVSSPRSGRIPVSCEWIHGWPHTYGWSWDDMTVDGDDGLLWFVVPATVVIRQDDGSETVAPYRLSGVLRRGRDNDWRFALFKGSEPTVPT